MVVNTVMAYPAPNSSDQSVNAPRQGAPELSASRWQGLRIAARERTIATLRRLADEARGSAFRLVLPDAEAIDFGKGDAAFTVRVNRPSGLDALTSLDALTIGHAYMDGDLDFEGDVVAALFYQDRLSDFHPAIYAWRRLQPILFGRPRVNPGWVALHYDAQNAQLHAADTAWRTYTPGVYFSDDDSLEVGADRKLTMAFEALRLERSQRLLEVGCGWGGMLRFCAQRGVHVTGLTLSRCQKEYVEQRIAEEQLLAHVHYQDFFTFQPAERFDAISMMGVIEDLSDYRTVMHSLSRWLNPGGRVYLDFASERERFGTHSFVTKHVWPGTFRMVFMPEFIEAVRESPFELIRIDNDRRNYHLWSRAVCERWVRNRSRIEAEHGERLWRTFLLLFAAVAAMMDRPTHSATAYRVLLELPVDSDGVFHTTKQVAVIDYLRRILKTARDGLLSLWAMGHRAP
jgi:cyclopropane-fatty-acyl-phospholipid synthase